MLASWPLQKALFQRLEQHPASSVFKTTAESAGDEPTCVIGGETGGPEQSSATTQAGDSDVELHFWAGDSDLVKVMMVRAHYALVDTSAGWGLLDLSGSGFEVLRTPRRLSHFVTPDPDPQTDAQRWHGVAEYRFLIEERPSFTLGDLPAFDPS